jgi:glycosyltransferase involved in cell wall biosynthesis
MVSLDRIRPAADAINEQARLRVFVHLANGYDALKWQANWRAGKVLGLNEEMPYGYHRAARHGCLVRYSRDYPEGRLHKALRYALRGLLGFDLLHAWRNREEIFGADVVWTHTESQLLSILFLFAVLRGRTKPKVIGQVIWLMDEWPRLGKARKRFYRLLLEKADVLTFLSPLNARIASEVFPDRRVAFVKFGINPDYWIPPKSSPDLNAIRVLSLGNDRHRDWKTLIEAVCDANNVDLHILTSKLKLRKKHRNISAFRVATNEALLAQFEWADVLVLTLKPNFHASGITVIEEAAILGVPIICTRVGGLEAYFDDDDVLYVDANAPEQITAAILRVASDDQLRQSMIANAKRRILHGGINSEAYVQRHIELSMELVNG